MRVASTMLALWFLAHYLYALFPVEIQGTVFNIARSAASLVMIVLVVLALPTRLTLLAGAGMAAEELQVIVCGSWWLAKPWKVEPGEELCSSGLGFPLGAVGLVLIGMLAGEMWARLRGRRAT